MKNKLLLTFVTLFALIVNAYAQEKTVTGTVTDVGDGSPIPGVNVIIKGSTKGTSTDINGKYTISIEDEASVLQYTFVGYLQQEVTVGNQSKIDVALEPNVKQLSEVVVTALGFEVDKDKTGYASSSVKGGRLKDSGEVQLINSMAGKLSGVNLNANSGDPGAGTKIVIRGATSINGGVQPLIIVDGVPINNSAFTGGVYNAVNSNTQGVTQQSRLNDLNPDDIESMEVLKGASAAALWGSRAANGVIVITTKKGKSGKGKKFSVSINSNITFDQVNRRVGLQNRWGKGSEGLFDPGSGSLSWGDEISARPGGADDIKDPNGERFVSSVTGKTYYPLAKGTQADPGGGKNSKETYDNQDEIFKIGYSTTNSVSIGSSNEQGDIYLSYLNQFQDGYIVTNSDYRKNTIRLNANRNLGKIFKVTTNLSYNKNFSNRAQRGSNLSGLLLAGLRTPADFDSRDYQGIYVDADGNETPGRQRAFRNYLGARGNSTYDNSLWLLNNIRSTSVVNRVVGKIALDINPLPWLKFTTRYGVDSYDDEREDYFPELASASPGGIYIKTLDVSLQENFDFIVRANADISSEFKARFVGGVNVNEEKTSITGGTNQEFLNSAAPPSLRNATAENTGAFDYQESIKRLGYYGTVSMDILDQIFLNFGGRLDYASTLPEENNGIFYPSVDVAWQFTKVLPASNILSFGKLRASYGRVGREPAPYSTNTVYVQSEYGDGWGSELKAQIYGGGFRRSRRSGNNDLKPEIKTEIEIGTDLRFLNDKITFGFTYYNNVTDDLLIDLDLPVSSGFAGIRANAAQIENKGIEIDLGAQVMQKGNFIWDINANWFTNKNTVTDMSGVESIFLGGFEGSASRAVIGQSLGVIYGTRLDRRDDGSLILDENGVPQQAAEEGVLGDPNPDFRFGITNTFTYKKLTLSILFEGSIGGDVWNGTRGALTFFGRTDDTEGLIELTTDQAAKTKTWDGQTVAAKWAGTGYQKEGGNYRIRGELKDFGAGEVFLDEEWYYSGIGSGFTGPTDQFVEDGSFVRLRQLSIDYSLSSLPFIKKLGLSTASVGFTGRNLLLFTKYDGIDPDTNLTGSGTNALGIDYFNNPSTRSFIFNFRASF